MPEKIENVSTTQFVEECIYEYGRYTIEQRALADYHDGLKPSHRRLLWAMYKMGIHHNSGFKKAARVIGETMGKYHPHGDCLSGDTLIPLLNGNKVTIKELVDTKSAPKWIIAYDDQNKVFVPAKARAWRVGQKTKVTYTIELSNGESVTCTGNHPFFIKDKGWVKARNIEENDKMIGGTINSLLRLTSWNSMNHPHFQDFSSQISTQSGDLCVVKVESEAHKEQKKMYDFTVDDYHNMVIYTSNGAETGNFVVAHNSGLYNALTTLVNSPEQLVIGLGNWGNYEESPAAMRYPECKLSKYADEYILDPDYLAVIPFVPSYDGSEKEPVYLPAKLPNLLINGSEGIATGCAALIPSYSKESVTKLVKLALQGKEITPQLCAKHLEFNFKYGGEDHTKTTDLVSFYQKGKGRLCFIPSHESPDLYTFKITSLAPRFTLSKKLEALIKLPEVKNIEDNREQKVIEFEVHLDKKLSKTQAFEAKEKIVKNLTCPLSAQVLVTNRQDDGESVEFLEITIPNLLKKWVSWRIDLETKVVSRLLQIERDKLQKQEWLLWAVIHVRDIAEALKTKDPKKYLNSKFDLEEDHIEYILDLQVRRLSSIEEAKIKSKIQEHKNQIKSLKGDLKAIEDRIINQLAA